MNRGRLALVDSPEFDYCAAYYCAGDCGQPHNDNERSAYVKHALATFDALNADDRRQRVDEQQAVRKRAKDAI